MSHRKPKRWRDLSDAQKYALVQSQALLWLGVGAVTYLLATKVSAVLAVGYAVPMLTLAGWVAWRIQRQGRRGL